MQVYQWNSLSSSTKTEILGSVDNGLVFDFDLPSLSYRLCDAVNVAYLETEDKMNQAKIAMHSAKTFMDELILNYSDYSEFPALMDFYYTVNDFYCSVLPFAISLAKVPEGTYEELDFACTYFSDYSNIGREQVSSIGNTFDN